MHPKYTQNHFFTEETQFLHKRLHSALNDIFQRNLQTFPRLHRKTKNSIFLSSSQVLRYCDCVLISYIHKCVHTYMKDDIHTENPLSTVRCGFRQNFPLNFCVCRSHEMQWRKSRRIGRREKKQRSEKWKTVKIKRI